MRFLEHFVFTCDQHDEDNPVKPFPVDRPHIRPLVQLWLDNPLIALVKSRQMVMTWLFCCLYLWEAMFHPGRLVMLQSKREEDAIGDETAGDGLMGRVKFVLNHIPRVGIVVPVYRARANRLEFPAINSTIWAIPQGADIIRQRTASGILSDECGFQDEFANAYTAAIPCIRGGGRFTALSTANPGFFQHLIQDTVSDNF